jgi:hypothetical protein
MSTNPLRHLADESFIDLLSVNAADDETGLVEEIARRLRRLIEQREEARGAEGAALYERDELREELEGLSWQQIAAEISVLKQDNTLLTIERDSARESATRVTDRNIELASRVHYLERQPSRLHCLECGNRGLHGIGCTKSPVENTSANPRDYYDTEYR